MQRKKILDGAHNDSHGDPVPGVSIMHGIFRNRHELSVLYYNTLIIIISRVNTILEIFYVKL